MKNRGPQSARDRALRGLTGMAEEKEWSSRREQRHAQSESEGGNLFSPHLLLHNGHVQTALALVKPQATDAYYIDQPILVDAGPDLCDLAVTTKEDRHVQLVAYYTPHRPNFNLVAEEHEPQHRTESSASSRGLVLMLHGWQGCSHSNYNRATTAALTRAGYDVARLNLRDHGPDYHLNPHLLNPGIFLGILIEEAHYAVQQLAHLAGDKPVYVIGVSMGGNFALRMALRHAKQPIANLRRVIAINPAINPAQATDNLDRNPFYRRFFRQRWLSSLLAKQRFYPELYNFDELHNYSTVRAMTERVIVRYGKRFGDFRTADEYFAEYAVTPKSLDQLRVPTTIITSQDDPIIPATDFRDLPAHPLLSLQLHPTGGHVGYVSLFPTEHYLPEIILRVLKNSTIEHFGDALTM